MKTRITLAFIALVSFTRISFAQSDPLTMEKFLQQGIYQGLKKGGFPQELAATMLDDKTLWVAKCPICDNVRRGFVAYQKEELVAEMTSSTQLVADLGDVNVDVRKLALKTLIDGYVQSYFEQLNMREEERSNMESKLMTGRKVGMSRAKGGEGFYCSSCDGACKMPKQ